MRILVIFLALIVLSLGSLIPQAKAGVDIGVSIGDEGLRGFSLAVGDYYRVPQREVAIIRERGIPYEEMPVVLFIAGRARVAPGIIVDLRLGGMSWMDITLRYGLSPEIYYVPDKLTVSSAHGQLISGGCFAIALDRLRSRSAYQGQWSRLRFSV